MNVEERLRAVAAEIAQTEAEIGILDHQIDFQGDVSEDARIRSMVSETPLAAREAREAAEDLARLVRVRDEARATVAALRAEQDQLLEALIEERRAR